MVAGQSHLCSVLFWDSQLVISFCLCCWINAQPATCEISKAFRLLGVIFRSTGGKYLAFQIFFSRIGISQLLLSKTSEPWNNWKADVKQCTWDFTQLNSTKISPTSDRFLLSVILKELQSLDSWSSCILLRTNQPIKTKQKQIDNHKYISEYWYSMKSTLMKVSLNFVQFSIWRPFS